ncbi:pyridoxamine 5'-phosphate oxidase family protein [Luteibacter yeojuensis]|uniref:pyridoxamine 5'-phosphate oxidase family protein n=1 Tax=Luteibacter yeojuensis TaxID=345309 RepID=UPI0019665A66|nr:pyridoxamine 5'-phosphate oxidase family protein [Luteibacter yeojuensis]
MEPKARTELRQLAARGTHEWEAIAAILDAGLLASVGFSVDGQPFVLPMLYGRAGRTLYLHGAASARIMTVLGGAIPVCVSVTLVDGMVLARSAFNHSMNYRSVVAFGTARTIEDPRAKLSALRALSEHMLAGRWDDVRGPNRSELAQTAVLAMDIEEASAKVRNGPPIDDEADLPRPTWAGVLPLSTVAAAPVADPQLRPGIALPSYLENAGEAGRS